jgi:hypothetical protein
VNRSAEVPHERVSAATQAERHREHEHNYDEHDEE